MRRTPILLPVLAAVLLTTCPEYEGIVCDRWVTDAGGGGSSGRSGW